MFRTVYALSGPVVLGVALALLGHWADRRHPVALHPVRLQAATASPEDLMALEGAGRALVRRVVLIRQVLDFSGPASLRWVPGVGGRRLHRWWPWLAGDGG